MWIKHGISNAGVIWRHSFYNFWGIKNGNGGMTVYTDFNKLWRENGVKRMLYLGGGNG